MNKPSINHKPILILVLNWIFGICAFIALLVVLFSYVWTDNKLIAPIHNFIWKHITNTYYVLSIFIILAVLSKTLAFILSFFIKKQEVTDTKQLTEKLLHVFTASAETTNQDLISAEERISAIEKQQEKFETKILQNCSKIQQELSYAEQRISLFTVENQQNLYRNIKHKTDLSHDISKLEVSQKLTQVIDLLEKAKTDIRTQ